MESLIFVALAVAWVVYLVPKGLKMHEESKSLDAVQDFSDELRVVARRDAVTKDEAELSVSANRRVATRSGRAGTLEVEDLEQADADLADADLADADLADAGQAEVADAAGETWREPVAPSRVRRVFGAVGRFFGGLVGRLVKRRRTARATRAERGPLSPAARRRRVLGALLVTTAGVTVAAATGLVSWWSMVVPVVLLVGWLAACRLMVRAERGARGRTVRPRRQRRQRPTPVREVVEEEAAEVVDEAATIDDEPVTPWVAPTAAPGSWDLVPTTLPTYLTKDAAGPRVTKPFTHDSTGVWSSGRNDLDSEIARQAARQAAEERERLANEPQRKLGS